MKHFILITLLISASFSSLANDSYSQIFTRQELLHHVYKDRYLELTDVNKREALQTWFRFFAQDKANLHAYTNTMDRTRDIVLGKDYRQLIYYYTVTGQTKKAAQTLGLYIVSAFTLLDNFSKDPQNIKWNPGFAEKVAKASRRFYFESIPEVEACYLEYTNGISDFNRVFSGKMAVALQTCVFYNQEINYLNDFLRLLFVRYEFHGAPFPISFTGLVGGNTVELLHQVPMELADIENLGQQLSTSLTTKASPLTTPYSQMSVDDFKTLMSTPESAVHDFFQNIKPVEEHNTFKYGIYHEIIRSIQEAKESVFIDLFWMGGSIGVNLAKELFKKVNENPAFSVYIITDSENKFQYAPELDFIYNYMRAFSEKFPEKNFYIMPANIGLKRTALPEFFDLLITDKVVDEAHENQGLRSLLEKDGFHLLAKSDHTKVFVIDGKNPHSGIAFVGSKNWTDSSGGLNYDEVAKIQGPAVAIVLNSFYYDTTEAFFLDHQKGGNLLLSHLNRKFPTINWNRDSKLKKGVQLLLEDMDVIGRSESFNEFTAYDIEVPYVEVGTSIVAPAQNNIYGTEMSALEQNIQAILSAKHQILVDDQFLYDPSVIEALKTAKVQNRVDIYILIETLQAIDAKDNTAAHIPNNLFVNELVELGIPVKWKITPSEIVENTLAETEKHKTIVNGNEVSPVVLGTTFHVKSISIDGLPLNQYNEKTCLSSSLDSSSGAPLLITGSANKDIMTMSGGFREYQVEAFDDQAVLQHDCLFWKLWNDPESSVETDGLNDFEIPQNIQDLKITDKETFLNILRVFFFTPYEFTKDYFN